MLPSPAGAPKSTEVLHQPALLLVIDDDRDQRELFRALFEGWGHAVVVAESADAACAILRDIHVDLVICDVNMPQVSAFELIPRLRSASDLAGLPIISMTADAHRDPEALLGCGADIHCAKRELRHLMAAVSLLLGGSVTQSAPLLSQIQKRFD